MADWKAANLAQRADRDAMDEVKRRESEGFAAVQLVTGDCGCTPGFVCRQNVACPRSLVRKRAAR